MSARPSTEACCATCSWRDRPYLLDGSAALCLNPRVKAKGQPVPDDFSCRGYWGHALTLDMAIGMYEAEVGVLAPEPKQPQGTG